jgi:AcrR family transcriptional regulator
VIHTLAKTGIGSRSLRDIAEAAGTSHRMLLHHFGSREELLVAVVEEVERQQMASLTALPPQDLLEGARALWANLRSTELRPFERLFFECYARAAQGEQPFARLLPTAVTSWITAITRQAPDGVDEISARLSLAVTRGLLLDLVATDDERAVDAAYERFITLLTNPSGRSR